MELVKFRANAIENYLELIPDKGWKDNSIYEITLKNVKDENGNVLNKKISLYTKLSPVYSDIRAVRSLMTEVELEDADVLYSIREASRYADYVAPYEIDENDLPYEVSQFVKYRAAHECLLGYAVIQTSNIGVTGTVGDVQFGDKETNGDLSKLLSLLATEVQKWMDAVKGYHNEGRAKMKKAVKGYYNDIAPIYRPVKVETWRGLDNR
jgi:hypothetical protein